MKVYLKVFEFADGVRVWEKKLREFMVTGVKPTTNYRHIQAA